jgi:PPOX class probable F420-dependent enzyme
MSSSPLENQKYISLTTYRRNGLKVPTPVWFVQRDGRVYVWTISTSGKVKRLRNNPNVALAPCKMGGETLGPYVEGVATMSEDDSSEELNKAFGSKYGLLFAVDRIVTRLSRRKRVFLEIKLT